MYQLAVNRSRLRQISAPKQHLAENKETQRIKASRPRNQTLGRPFQPFGPPRFGKKFRGHCYPLGDPKQ
jgi:hypothetical protein